MKGISSTAAFSVAFALIFETAAANAQESIRDDTYCEILWGPPPTNGTTVLTVSWNGTGGMCPANPGFYNVTEQDVRDVHGQENATIVVWNGMRQWTLDALLPQENNTVSETESVFDEYGSDIFEDGSGLVMRQAATVPTNVLQSGPYKPNPVTRKVTAVWNAGTMVYELVAPNCSAVYTMQSVFLGRPGNLGVTGDLATLETSGTITPPQGWEYRVRTLEEDLVIEGEDGVTKVVQDDVANTYSCHDMPLDPSVCDELTGGTSSSARSSVSRFVGFVMSSLVLLRCIV